MSGHFRIDTSDWESLHYAAAWTRADPAPRWWAAFDFAYRACTEKPADSAACARAWGWSRMDAQRLIYAQAERQTGYAETDEERSTWRRFLVPTVDDDPDETLFELPGPLTHADVVARAVRWLRGHHGCRPVFAEINTYERVNPDAIGFRKPGGAARAWSVLVEAKVSRGDFRADRAKIIHRLPDLCPGQERWYLTPPNLIRPEEVPAGWGLAECGARSVRVVVPAPIAESPNLGRASADMGILLSAVRRHEAGARWFDELAKFEPYYAKVDKEGAK